MKRDTVRKADYSQFKRKLFAQSLLVLIGSFAVIVVLYVLAWKGRGSELLVKLIQVLLGMDADSALYLYQQVFRNNIEILFLLAAAAVFLLLYWVLLRRFTRYFNAINGGIDALMEDDGSRITLPPEMTAVEEQLNAVRDTLRRREREAQQAEQRKNDLVTYLAHDIRTPLTSVIGYLSLLDEAPDMPEAQKEKYTHIALEKAYRLEKLVNEFFEITRYNLQQLHLERESIDLYYMLAQMVDEFYPILSARGNTAVLRAAEDLVCVGDPEKLARVFNNILKNAAAYSDPGTEIVISAERREQAVVIVFQDQGRTIPPEKLATIFEKFYRLDEARATDTGGAGLGLSIAQEIVHLHGGTISAASENGATSFTVTLPLFSNESTVTGLSKSPTA